MLRNNMTKGVNRLSRGWMGTWGLAFEDEMGSSGSCNACIPHGIKRDDNENRNGVVIKHENTKDVSAFMLSCSSTSLKH